MDWSRPTGEPGFYSRELPERAVIEDDSIGGYIAGTTRLPAERQAVVEETHRLISSRWVNGGLVSGLYWLEPFDVSRFETSLNQGLPVPSAAAIPQVLDSVAEDGLLPAELAGCSTALLEREGAVWEETLAQFGNAIYWAMKDGGAYSEAMNAAEAEARTRRYLAALVGETPADRIHLFGLDPAFSGWFQGLYWDFAYVAVNRSENWLALVCATDVD